MNKRLCIVFCFLYIGLNVCSQNISQKTFESLLTADNKVYFDKNTNRFFGCGINLTCFELPVLFKSIVIDRKNKNLTISGIVNPDFKEGDTIGTNDFNIFLARPRKKNLRNIRVLIKVDGDVKFTDSNSSIDDKKYNFSISFRYTKNDFLYIESGQLYKLKEYQIGKLLMEK